jgi:hypothetical protein
MFFSAYYLIKLLSSKMDLSVTLHEYPYIFFNDLPIYSIYEILKYVPIEELIKMEQINKKFSNIIRNSNWPHSVKIKKEVILIYVITRYKFNNFDLRYSDITDKGVKMLGNGNRYSLNLAGCKGITDESVMTLGNCYSLNLSWCKQLTNASIKKLDNCHSLNLSWCDLITNEGVRMLKCHELNIFGCSQITDARIKMLSNRITTEGIRMLNKIEIISIRNEITTESIRMLNQIN